MKKLCVDFKFFLHQNKFVVNFCFPKNFEGTLYNKLLAIEGWSKEERSEHVIKMHFLSVGSN